MTALLYVQSDGTLLVDSRQSSYFRSRRMLLAFADMVGRVDPFHVYRIQPVTLWQAAAMHLCARDVLAFLRSSAAHPLPFALQRRIVDEMAKWGQLLLQRGAANRIVLCGPRPVLETVAKLTEIAALCIASRSTGLVFAERDRALVKRHLTRLGHPVIDRAGYTTAPSVIASLTSDTTLRPYQLSAVDSFFGAARGESGVVVLPCGSGKTLVAISILCRVGMNTLILTPGREAAAQWLVELRRRTTVSEQRTGIYRAGEAPPPICVTTYQLVTHRSAAGEMPHWQALTSCPWGLIVYDEVHMLPAPMFRLAADVQSARRLGLTATLVREDGAEADVFSLIGPKCFDVPWKELEQTGYVAAVRCVQVNVPLSAADRDAYSTAAGQRKHRIAAANARKIQVVRWLLGRHRRDSTLILGHYLDSLAAVAGDLQLPMLTGATPHTERLQWYDRFRQGETRCLVLSRIANSAVDLPTASVAIQVSGLFGSRQEEAQRLGRLLRPETAEGVFYTIVSSDTVEADMAKRRQTFLVEQGYSYAVEDVRFNASGAKMEGACESELFGMSEHR